MKCSRFIIEFSSAAMHFSREMCETKWNISNNYIKLDLTRYFANTSVLFRNATKLEGISVIYYAFGESNGQLIFTQTEKSRSFFILCSIQLI